MRIQRKKKKGYLHLTNILELAAHCQATTKLSAAGRDTEGGFTISIA
jgi:hypothetical protein